MPDTILKRWNGTAFEELYPKTITSQISASGTPSASTFLRGDGQWQIPATQSHTHGNIQNNGIITATPVTIESGDTLLIANNNNSQLIERGVAFGTATTTFLRNDGTWATPSDTTTLTGLGITATAAELNFVDGVTSNVQTQLNGKQATITGAATTITGSNLTALRVLGSDVSGKVAATSITTSTLAFLDATSSVQTQLNGKAATSHTHTVANITDIASNYVDLAGNQTITGLKTISTTLTMDVSSGVLSDTIRFQSGQTYGGPGIRGNGLNLERNYYLSNYTMWDSGNSNVWLPIRTRTAATSLTSTSCTGTTGGSIAAGATLAQGDTIMMEVSDTAAVTAGNEVAVVIFTLGAADTTPTSLTQGITYRSSYSSTTVHYDYFFKVSHSGSTLYFDDSFRITFTDTSTASSIITQAGVLLHVGRIWRLA
jgi:hypothetical protein